MSNTIPLQDTAKLSAKELVKKATPWALREWTRKEIRSLKGKIWDLLSSREITQEIENQVLYSKTVSPFTDIEFSDYYNQLFKGFGFEPLSSYKWIEKVARINRTALIEPRRGWIICSPFHLIRDCLIDSDFVEKPWIISYLSRYLSGNTAIEHHPTVISLRDGAECNYWHFLNDIVGGRLRLVDECELSPDIPLVISKHLYNQPFFQAVLKRSRLEDRPFILQDGQFIQSENVFYCKTSRHQRKNIEYILNFLNVPDSHPKSDRRIFLNRGRKPGRNLLNLDAIEEICREFNFESVDTGQMSLDEQIQLFSEARYVIGIHGAGLVNTIFRRNAMLSLLEIFPPMANHPYGASSPPPLHYFWCAHALGFNYDLIFGEAGSASHWASSFELNVDLFSKKLKTMLDA